MDIKSHSPPYLLIASIIVAALVAIIAWVVWGFTMPQQPDASAPPVTTPAQDEQKDASDGQPAVIARQVKVAYIAIGDNSRVSVITPA